MKRILALVLLFMFLPLCGIAESSAAYNSGLASLDSYMSSYRSFDFAFSSLEEICNDLLQSRHAHYREFYMYTSALASIETEAFSEAETFLAILDSYPEFNALLASSSFRTKYPHIGTVADMRCYLQARQFESNGNRELAKAYYLQCIDFYDSLNRVGFQSSGNKNYAYDGSQLVGRTIRLNMSTGSAHARSGPGESYDFVAYVYTGDVYTLLDSRLASNGKPWYKIRVDGKYGWISSGLSSILLD